MIKAFMIALTLGLVMFFAPTPALAAPNLNAPSGSRVLIMGDSYTQGVGARPMTEGWAYNIGSLGWKIDRDGKGGSGYCNPTSYGAGVFASRMDDHLYDSYDLIVLQGSSNDARYSSYDLAVCINKTIRTVKNRFPHAQILMVGPTNPYGNFPSTSTYWMVDSKLKAAASSYDINYISPMSEKWFVPGDGDRYAQESDPGKGHPNNAGYQHYANRFVQDVNNL